ncbi:hypothetical protein DER46DRAFT_387625 [Fusarium sp. MPI-SDFR-AT-0072]|nr:hypothetical protein DER46DRAFT_387625 [Fusarium sp. MPI-SDFR-AT-0072]
MTNLLRLPAEITELIFAELPPSDLLRLRQACREANARTIHIVGPKFFQKGNVTLERQSLQCLSNVSKCHHLASSIRTLNICTYQHLSFGDIQHTVSHFDWYMQAIDLQRELEDLKQLLLGGRDIEALAQILRRLTGCKRINIYQSDQPSDMRNLDCGLNILSPTAFINQSSKGLGSVRDIFHVVLAAVVSSGLDIEILDFTCPKLLMGEATPVVHEMFAGLSSVISERSGLESLRDLRILLDLTKDISTGWVSEFVHFMGLFPQLVDLQLHFQPQLRFDRESCKEFATLWSTLYIPNLEKLDLGSIDCTGSDLSLFILRHRTTLREIHLETINPIDGTNAWNLIIEILRCMFDAVSFTMVECLSAGRELQYLSDDGEDFDVLEATSPAGLGDIALSLRRAI